MAIHTSTKSAQALCPRCASFPTENSSQPSDSHTSKSDRWRLKGFFSRSLPEISNSSNTNEVKQEPCCTLICSQHSTQSTDVLECKCALSLLKEQGTYKENGVLEISPPHLLQKDKDWDTANPVGELMFRPYRPYRGTTDSATVKQDDQAAANPAKTQCVEVVRADECTKLLPKNEPTIWQEERPNESNLLLPRSVVPCVYLAYSASFSDDFCNSIKSWSCEEDAKLQSQVASCSATALLLRDFNELHFP